MSYAAIAADFHKSFDVKTYFAFKFALYFEVMFDVLSEFSDVVLGKVLYSYVGIDAGFFEYFLRGRSADTVYISDSLGKSTPAIRAICISSEFF